jgi:hypothetical protein
VTRRSADIAGGHAIARGVILGTVTAYETSPKLVELMMGGLKGSQMSRVFRGVSGGMGRA